MMLERGGRNTRKLSPILTLRCDTEHTDAKLSGKEILMLPSKDHCL